MATKTLNRKTLRKQADKASRDNELADTLGLNEKPKKKCKQKYLEDSEGSLEPERIQEIEAAAAKYVTIRDRRMELTEDEADAKGKLKDAMKSHGLTSYKCEDGRFVEVIHGDDNVKVRAPILDGSD